MMALQNCDPSHYLGCLAETSSCPCGQGGQPFGKQTAWLKIASPSSHLFSIVFDSCHDVGLKSIPRIRICSLMQFGSTLSLSPVIVSALQ